ncbi:MAG TPA: hypothetical protein VGD75_16205 [Bradyrhizobium sp.]
MHPSIQFQLLAGAVTADAPNLLASAELTKLKPFRARFKLGKQTAMDGNLPEHWSVPAPDEFTSGEIFHDQDNVQGSKAFGLQKSEGPSPIQFRCDGIQLLADKPYALTFNYLTAGGSGAARLMVDRLQHDKTHSIERALTDTGGSWKSVAVTITPRRDALFELQLHCYAVGVEKAIYFSSLSLALATPSTK